MTRNPVPSTATVEATAIGIGKSGPLRGHNVFLTLYVGKKSLGRRNNYQRIPCRWLCLETVDDLGPGFCRFWQYSGRRYDLAKEHYERARDLLTVTH